jgi:hypothetical protein
MLWHQTLLTWTVYLGDVPKKKKYEACDKLSLGWRISVCFCQTPLYDMPSLRPFKLLVVTRSL